MGIVKATKRSVQVGTRFGRLVVDGAPFTIPNEHGKYITYAVCVCDCGARGVFWLGSLKRGTTKSCGCFCEDGKRIRQITHGASSEAIYIVWVQVRQRCNNPKNKQFHLYGGRGITVCDEWNRSFDAFSEWAHRNGYQSGLQIDRRDNNGPYAPWNCRWVDRIVQGNNKRTNVLLSAFGEEKSIADWSRDSRCVANYEVLLKRVQRLNWDVQRALTTPVREQP